jgi:site-specific DNA-methyltransferase (adenine-specific)
VPVDDEDYARNCSGDRGHADNRSRDAGFKMGCGHASETGRWPANVVHDGSAEVIDAFATFGEKASGKDCVRGKSGAWSAGDVVHGGLGEAGQPQVWYGDTGTAARFFYCAKASWADRNQGLEGMPRKMLRWSAGDQSPGTFQSEGTDKFAANHHPTVKPTALMRWLCKLITLPGGLIIDPFAGSGSTGKAAVMDGFRFIGIEKEPEYVEIARRRIAAARAECPLFAGV